MIGRIAHSPEGSIGEVRVSLNKSSEPDVIYVKKFLSEPFSDGDMRWQTDAVCFLDMEGRTITVGLSNCMVIRYKRGLTWKNCFLAF